MSFFSIRTNDQDSIKKILSNEKNIVIPGITWLFDKVGIDDLVFVVLSGDEGKKEFPYSNGLKAIARIVDKIVNEYKDEAKTKIKSYSIHLDIISFLPKVITKKDFYLYPDLLDCPSIGPETKSSPNQALGQVEGGICVLQAINDLYPNELPQELLDLIPNDLALNKVKLKDIKKSLEKVPQILDREVLVGEFVKWFNQPKNFKNSYGGLFQKKVILSWDKIFFDNKLFEFDLNNIQLSIENIKKLKKNYDDTSIEWISFSGGVSRGAPKAVLGDNNYLKFLDEFDFSQFIQYEKYELKHVIEKGCFIDENVLSNYLLQLKQKKNIILQGPPGTGKTWLAQQLAKVIVQYPNQQNIQNVQFHPNYSYEDLIRGWRPRSDGKLELVDGPFLAMIDLAKQYPDQNFVFIFDEINRGDPSVIFGEMLTLLENSKRSEQHALSLTYRKHELEKVHIPDNLYIIGTMNTADKSLNHMDFAFRRRFGFFNLKPMLNEAWSSWLSDKLDVELIVIEKIRSFVGDLNQQIEKKNGVAYMLGHSFFVPIEKVGDTAEQLLWMQNVVENEIKPLLAEYWYDDIEKVQSISFE
ncbi:McrB family protein [Acinetobacter sp. TY2]|uniref:McrB family protein n=1 Tax=Acinetobacter sp. TY2 TaxID=3387403 RepID=UPI003917736E